MYKLIYPCFFVLSYFLLGYYTGGDQKLYISFYENVKGLNLIKGFYFYKNVIGSSEPIYFLISYIFANLGIPKEIFISLANTVILYVFVEIGRSLKVNITILLVIGVANFYFIVMYTELERLKFGFLFFLLSLKHQKSTLKLYFYSILSVFTHVQFSILYFGIILISLRPKFSRLIKNFYLPKNVIFPLLFIFVFSYVMWDHVINKLKYYYNGLDILSFLKALPLVALSIIFTKKPKEAILINIILLISALFIGSDRVNILIFFSFLYFSFQLNNGRNIAIFITTLYFLAKSSFFIFNIFNYGRGY